MFRFIFVATLTILAAVVLFQVTGAPSAQAHAVQVGSSPTPNEQLATSPTEISVLLSEPVEPSVTSIQLWNQEPVEVPLGAVTYPTESEILAQVPEELPMGIYTVIWRALSTVDGHSWAGSFVFVVLGPNGEVPAGSAPTELQDLAELPSNTPKALDTAARWLVLLGSTVMVGGFAYAVGAAFPAARVLSPESGERLHRLSRTVLLVTGAIAALLVIQGSLLQLGVQADRLGGLDQVDEILRDTRFGNYLVARQVLLLIVLASLAVIWRARAPISTVAYAVLGVSAVGVLLTQSMVSHAGGGGDGSFWTTSADFLHLLAASLWIGALVHIALAMPRWLDDLKGAPRTLFAAESFRRFSLLAVVSVSILMASGVFSALAQFTAWDQLWETNYGLALLSKLALMMPLLAIGAMNALYLGRRVEVEGMRMAGASVESAEELSSIERLQRLLSQTVRIEAALAIAVLVSVGVLIQLEPARAEAEVEEARAEGPAITGELPQDEKGYFLKANQSGGLVVSLKVDPAEVGVNNFEVGLGSEFGSVGEVQLARLEFANAAAGIAESQLDLPLVGSAKHAAEGANISQGGEWEITATIRRRGEDDVQTTFTVPVRRAGDDASAAAGGDDSRWSWPFDGAQSTAAIAVMVLGAVVTAGAATWQLREFRRS